MYIEQEYKRSTANQRLLCIHTGDHSGYFDLAFEESMRIAREKSSAFDSFEEKFEEAQQSVLREDAFFAYNYFQHYNLIFYGKTKPWEYNFQFIFSGEIQRRKNRWKDWIRGKIEFSGKEWDDFNWTAVEEEEEERYEYEEENYSIPDTMKRKKEKMNEMERNIIALKSSLPIKIWETQKRKPDKMRIDNLDEANIAYEQIYAKDSEEMSELLEKYNEVYGSNFVGPKPNIIDFLKGKEVQAFDLLSDDMNDEELLKYATTLSKNQINNELGLESMFVTLVTLSSLKGNLGNVATEMMTKFKNGYSDEYSNDDLTDAVFSHKTTLKFIEESKKAIGEQLKSHKFFMDKNFQDDLNAAIQEIESPKFESKEDMLNGLTILLHGIWDMSIEITSFDSVTHKGKLKYTMRDHFGLDIDDLKTLREKNNIKKGENLKTKFTKIGKNLVKDITDNLFDAWFALQHSNNENFKYKWEPFTTVMVKEDIDFEVTDNDYWQ